jgi:hypothetical protein
MTDEIKQHGILRTVGGGADLREIPTPIDSGATVTHHGDHRTIGEATEIRAVSTPIDSGTVLREVTAGGSSGDSATQVSPAATPPAGGTVREAPAPALGGAVTASRAAGGVEIREGHSRAVLGASEARPRTPPPVIVPHGPIPTGDGQGTTVTNHGLDPRFKGDPRRDPAAWAAAEAEENEKLRAALAAAEAKAAKEGI